MKFQIKARENYQRGGKNAKVFSGEITANSDQIVVAFDVGKTVRIVPNGDGAPVFYIEGDVLVEDNCVMVELAKERVPLTGTVLSALKEKQLDVSGLVETLVHAGYRPKSRDFAMSVYRVVRSLIKKGKVIESGDTDYPHYRPTYKLVRNRKVKSPGA